MLVRAYVLESSVRSNLGTTGRTSEHIWVGVDDSRRAPTIGSTGFVYVSGKVTGNPSG